MRFEFHPDALLEYDEAALYYASCRPGLEVRFMAAVEEAIARVVQTPERWPVIEGAVHRCLTRVFPYVVLYTIEPDYVLIDSARKRFEFVTPAKADVQSTHWIPAFAGMTNPYICGPDQYCCGDARPSRTRILARTHVRMIRTISMTRLFTAKAGIRISPGSRLCGSDGILKNGSM